MPDVRSSVQREGPPLIGATVAALIGVLALSSACGQQDSPVQAVENYLRLRVASDAPKLLAVSCKDWESQASVEAASFQSMNALRSRA